MLKKVLNKLKLKENKENDQQKVISVFNLNESDYQFTDNLTTHLTAKRDDLSKFVKGKDSIFVFRDISQAKQLEEFTQKQYQLKFINEKYYIMPTSPKSTEFGTHLFRMNVYIIYIDINGFFQFIELNALDSIMLKNQTDDIVISNQFTQLSKKLFALKSITLYETIIVDKFQPILKLKTLDNDLKQNLTIVEINNKQHLNLRGKSYTLINPQSELFLIKSDIEYHLYSENKFHNTFRMLDDEL